MNEEEKTMVETAAFFVSDCYATWFLKSYYLVEKSPLQWPFCFQICLSHQRLVPKAWAMGTHCLPACSAIAGTCLSSWFCYPLAMMTLRRCWSPICGIGFSPMKFLSSSESGSLSCLLFTCQQSWVSLLVHRVGYFWKWLNSWGGGAKVDTGT